MCKIYNRDPWTWVLTLWAALQLTWLTMLVIVQAIQISRNQTTLENMRKNMEYTSYNASQAVTATLAAGTPSLGAAGLTTSGMGPNPATVGDTAPPRKRPGFLGSWVKLLGLDNVVAIARNGTTRDPVTGRLQARERRANPWSRGIVTNCQDFWRDPAPYFGTRTGSEALLGGERVNYARMYDMPRRTTGSRGMVYTSVADEESV